MVYLLLELKDRDGKMPIKDKIKLLSETGMDYNQIASVLGKTPGNIAVYLTMLKKSKKEIKEEGVKEENEQRG